MSENINHPPHYASHPSGVECVDIAEHLSFNLGNALKYLWRAGIKYEHTAAEDRKKALWYLRREKALSDLDRGHLLILAPVTVATLAGKVFRVLPSAPSAFAILIDKLMVGDTRLGAEDFQALIAAVEAEL
jgi:hypothetical protein